MRAKVEEVAGLPAIIAMGKALGLTVVAEGVETEEQSQLLKTESCDELQGYLFSRPVAAEKIAALVAPRLDSPGLQPSGHGHQLRTPQDA
jgi:EAL domain-containing protein (putative c-di-GMP-specific phosphodiesterase class I)